MAEYAATLIELQVSSSKKAAEGFVWEKGDIMGKSSWKVLQRTGGVKLEQGAAGGRCMPLSGITRRKGDPCQSPDGMGRCDSAWTRMHHRVTEDAIEVKESAL